jgi:UDP-N-acetylglucosamine--N-acetylmuramyl-(pentapeptide) pyrophosphoryl-undecaprenol N-acetylglucosamine transferase
LLVAAGGTGGHIYPALAVAKKLIEMEPESKVIFCGTERGLEGRIIPRAGFPLELVRVEPLRGGSFARKVKAVALLPLAFLDALSLLRRTRPQVVMGVGGYVSGPIMAVAGTLRVPTLLLEPNATPGLANRWLAPFIDAAALAWEDTRRFFKKKGFVSGNPVRDDIARVGVRAVDNKLRVLVFGGSQGSHVLNQAMLAALPHLERYRERLEILHQTGEGELESVRAGYRQTGIAARVEPYLAKMSEAYAESDLVVSRAGATTCAELAAAGRPSVLVPLPIAGGHQKDNAEMMERAGAALTLDEEALTGEHLAQVLTDLMKAPDERKRMAERARALARPEASRIISERLLELAGWSGGRGL